MHAEADGDERKGKLTESLENQGIIKNPRMDENIGGLVFGGDEGDRTPDLCIANAALSQLSYTPTDQIFQPQAYACEGNIMPEADIESKSLRHLERRFKAPFLNVRQLLFQQIP